MQLHYCKRTKLGTNLITFKFNLNTPLLKLPSMHPHASSHLLGQFSGGGKHESLCLLEAHIDLLEDRDSKCSGFAGTGLRLGDDVTVTQARDDGALLDGGRLLKTVCIDATEQLLT